MMNRFNRNHNSMGFGKLWLGAATSWCVRPDVAWRGPGWRRAKSEDGAVEEQRLSRPGRLYFRYSTAESEIHTRVQ